MSERTRKDGIIMRHVVTGRDHWWQAERGESRSGWFRDDEHKTGYQRSIDDLAVVEMNERVLCSL